MTEKHETENRFAPLSLRGWLSYYIIKSVFLFIYYSPAFLFRLFCRFGCLVTRLYGRDGRIIRKNLDFIYGDTMPEKDKLELTDKCLRHQVYSTLESIRYMKRYKSFQIDNLEILEKVYRECGERGIVMVTAHLGGWEILSRVFAETYPRKVYALAKPSRNPGFTRILHELRVQCGIDVIWTEKATLIKNMLRALKGKGMLCFVSDQKPDKGSGFTVPFLGKDTRFVAGPATMALKTGAESISVYCIRTGFQKYRVEASHYETLPEDPEELTAVYAENIEQAVREHPEQWCWNYRRWKIR